ncbi:hypothetical protein B0T26DRAFT_712582 [Lasiosphaeria miniovina]|uniref:Uncharacterized protein n=1 Tax=Lasiosphaeria miniovina TaxID=1954250 RepID=A0AA40ALW6_9PEZI|nr:uncharacterized protein B0T26DRAFT_712582 [Lasiosphaeria miniovina]KAK0718261.1 hypothetical protein B0T26DRAFT_712582 [Lasiosphaeria miniovina]
MANPRPGASDGPSNTEPNGPQSSGGDGGGGPFFTRPFTLLEALPYTPFTSIVPIDSGLILPPSIGAASPAPSLNDLISSQDFDALNQEAQTHDTASKRLQQTMSQLQHLIKRTAITELYVLTSG